MEKKDTIVVLDFGSQYSKLIARRIRENKVYCLVLPFDASMEEIQSLQPKGIILSGGPSSVYTDNAPMCNKSVFALGIPVLGICYGMQLGCMVLKGEVESVKSREYGNTLIQIIKDSALFKGVASPTNVWMSHGDQISKLPETFEILAQSDSNPYVAIKHKGSDFYGVQFHPEVTHTSEGEKILNNFLFSICKCQPTWKMESFIESSIRKIREAVGDGRVVLGLSGGVDSSVAAVLIQRAIGDNLHPIFVDNGLLRKDEAQQVVDTFQKHFSMNLHFVDARKRFLDKLKGVTDPEEKRKVIGHTFIDVFAEEAHKIKDVRFLAQGTLYPDVIESASSSKSSAKIKSHHNVGGLPDKLDFELVEPLKELFKDEVRKIGKELGMPDVIIKRQPFPGPGLAVRVIGVVTQENLDILREADAIVNEEMVASGLYDKVWQSFAVLLPVSSVGVMGDERTYENVIALRVVQSLDGMTADWVRMPYEVLGKISNRIINEVKGVNRVVYDISSKPPSTIEWE